MIILVLILLIILIIFASFIIISNIIKLDSNIKRLILNNYLTTQKIVINADRIKKIFNPQIEKRKKIKYSDIVLMTVDIILTEIYKTKYEKFKLIIEFIKATMA